MSTQVSQAQSDQRLPAGFQDFESFVGKWALATERERNRTRLSASMAEIQALYDALLPRMEEIIGYLNQFPLDNLPEDAKRLFHFCLSLAEIAPAVELFGQPGVIDGFPADRFVPVEVPHMTPSEN